MVSRKNDANAPTPWKMHKSYPPSMNWWIVIAAFRLLNIDDWLLTMQKETCISDWLVAVGRWTVWRPWRAEVSLGLVCGLTQVLFRWGTRPYGSLGGLHGPHPPSCLLWVCAVSRFTVQACLQICTQHLVCALPLTFSMLMYTPTYWKKKQKQKNTRHHKPATHCHVWLIIPVLHVLYCCHLEAVLSNCRPVAGF